MADHDTHDHTGIPGCGSPADIVDLPTAETDASLVLAPDGVGGVEFRAESGGGGGGLVLLEQHTASGGGTMDFTAWVSSTYDTYILEIIDLLPDTDNVSALLRYGTGGGPTYDTTSGDYQWTGIRSTAGAASGAGGSSTSTSINLDTGDTLDVTGGISGFLKIYNPASASGVAKRAVGEFAYYANSGPQLFLATHANMFKNTAAITALRLFFSAGNVASGTARMFGIVKT